MLVRLRAPLRPSGCAAPSTSARTTSFSIFDVMFNLPPLSQLLLHRLQPTDLPAAPPTLPGLSRRPAAATGFCRPYFCNCYGILLFLLCFTAATSPASGRSRSRSLSSLARSHPCRSAVAEPCNRALHLGLVSQRQAINRLVAGQLRVGPTMTYEQFAMLHQPCCPLLMRSAAAGPALEALGRRIEPSAADSSTIGRWISRSQISNLAEIDEYQCCTQLEPQYQFAKFADLQ